AELRALAVRPGGPQDFRADHHSFQSLLSRVPLVPAGDRGAFRRHHRPVLAVPETKQVRRVDPRHHAGPRDGAGHGDPRAVGLHRRLRHRRRPGGGKRRAVCADGGGHPHHGPRLGAEGLHRRRGRRHGQSRRLDRGRDLHQPARSLCGDLGQPGTGGDRLLHRPHPHSSVPADRPLRSDAKMTTAPLDKSTSLPRGRLSHTAVYWIGFCVVMALLIVAPLVLPVFWRRFLTEVLIWGLLAMSSDLLIGYTGMVSFGHSAFFGLGIYGAAAALLLVSPPNLWLAIGLGLAAAAAVAAFVAYFSTRLRDIYFAITTLIFSQIF